LHCILSAQNPKGIDFLHLNCIAAARVVELKNKEIKLVAQYQMPWDMQSCIFFSVCVCSFPGVQSLEGKPQVIWCMAPPQMGDCIGSLSIGLRIHSLVKGAQIGCPQFSQLGLSKVLSLSLSLSHTHTHTIFVNIFVPPKIVEFFLSLQMHAAHLFFG
jgi:hypothetical protein